MRVEICGASELGPSEIDLWHRFQKRDARLGNPFLAPEFTMAVGRARSDVRVAVISDGEEIVGFLPFTSVAGRFARPVGPGISDLQAVVQRVDHPIHVVDVVTSAGLVGWYFDHLLSFQVPTGQPVSPGQSWVVDLRQYAASFAGNSKLARPHYVSECARKLRRLEREHRSVEFRFGTGSEPALARLFELKRAQCRREGWRDVLATPWVAEVVNELARTRSEALTGVVSALLAGDEIVSVELGIRSADLYVSWFHAYDLRFSRHSPGSLLWYQLFPRLTEGGVRCIDLGKGLTEAKRRFSTGTIGIAEGFAARHGPVGGCALTMARLGGIARGRAPSVESAARRAIRSVRRWRYRMGEGELPDPADFQIAGAQS